jgi:hypothetical protein
MRRLGITRLVAQNINERRGFSISAQTTHHVGCRISQVIRKRIKANGRIKSLARIARTRHRGAA